MVVPGRLVNIVTRAEPPQRCRSGGSWALASRRSLLGGCGYTLQGNLPDHLKTVSVPVFKNRTTEPGAESTITSAVVNAFTTNGRLQGGRRSTEADSILEGEIIGYSVQSPDL